MCTSNTLYKTSFDPSLSTYAYSLGPSTSVPRTKTLAISPFAESENVPNSHRFGRAMSRGAARHSGPTCDHRNAEARYFKASPVTRGLLRVDTSTLARDSRFRVEGDLRRTSMEFPVELL